MQQVKGYLRLAETVAEMVGSNPDDAKISVLRDTSLWQVPISPLQDGADDERAVHLAMGIREMARHVIREGQLEELFGKARRIPGLWSPTNSCFRPSTMACLFQRAYEGWNEHWTETPPLPSVPLVRFQHAVVQVSLLVAQSEETNLDVQSPNPNAEAMDTDVRLYREIRLCLGPTTAEDRIGTMFETRAYVEALPDEEAASPWLVDPCVTVRTLKEPGIRLLRNNKWFRARSLADLDDASPNVRYVGRGWSSAFNNWFYWDVRPLEKERWCIEHDYTSWTPPQAGYVSHWLDQPEHRDLMYSIVPDEGPYDRPTETWFPRPSLAHDVEVSLSTGALETALLDQIDRLRGALDEREEVWRSAASAASVDALTRWQPTESDE